MARELKFRAWEDYKEPEIYYRIDSGGFVYQSYIDEYLWSEPAVNSNKAIGNYFETEEEAEKVVEKLKAWKRLKDKGFEFERWQTWEKVSGLACFDKGVAHSYYAGFTFRSEDRLEKDEQVKADLDLLFGGKE